MRLLIVEDDASLAATLQDELEETYAVDLARTAREGTYAAEVNAYDLIILDYTLPDAIGIDVCRGLRSSGVEAPILMLTGRGDVADKVAALDAGVDDYLTKPFSFDELHARVRALMRRSAGELLDTVLRVGDLSLDVASRIVKRGGMEIQLRRKELDLLEYLMRNEGRVVTRSMILEHVWNSSVNSFTNAIDVHVKHLRDRVDRPFEIKLIHTVYGLGYRLGQPTQVNVNL